MNRLAQRFRPATRRGASAGLATLASLLLLMMASLLAAAWAQRSSLNEIRSAANQQHNAAAFEAAEAGLAWTQAMLNGDNSLGADCKPEPGANASSFSSRYLHTVDDTGRFSPRSAGPGAAPLKWACARGTGGWSCSCPADSAPVLSAQGTETMPMFTVQLQAGVSAGSIEVVAQGCSHIGRPCLDGSAGRADATSRLRLSLAFLPTLASPPAAALSTLGNIDAPTSALGLHNADALSGGLAAHAGGQINGPALRISTAPGATKASAVLQSDTSLASLPSGQFFSRHFGTDLVQWKHQPGVEQMECIGDCSATLLTLIEPHQQLARIAINGDLRLEGKLQIGTRAKPVVLVVDGNLILNGPVQVHGIVYAQNMQWNAVAQDEGGLLHGAALLSASFSGDGAPDLVYDATLMLRLRRQHGIWVRVPGSWRDF